VAGVDELAARVPDGARVSIGGFHFSRIPMRLVEAVARRRAQRLTSIQWGGGLGLEILLEAGCIEHIVFCFSSLDVFGLAPHFRADLEAGGVTSEEYTALELHHALLAAEMNLPWLPLQAPAGSWRAPHLRRSLLSRSPAIDFDVVLLHAQRADEDGNVQIVGSAGLDRTLALAGRRVLVTVEEIVDRSRFQGRTGVVPRQFVEAIAAAPGGAWPTACIPNYTADYLEVATRVERAAFAGSDRQTTAIRGPGDDLIRAAGVKWASAPWPSPDTTHRDTADLLVAWLARELDNAAVCSVGATSPLATVAYLVAKATHAPRLTLITHNGGYIDVGRRFASLTFAEPADFQSAAVHCGGDDSYRWYYQQSRVTHEIVGAAQIDGAGRTNNSWIDRPDGRRLRMPGQGGMADVANMHRNFILYAPRQSKQQLVEHVDLVSAARGLTAVQRRQLGYGAGDVVLVTDLAVFRLGEGRQRFHLETLHPGVTLKELRSQTGFEFDAPARPAETVPPTESECRDIARVDPFGIRRIEFVPSRQRISAIREIAAREREYLGTIT
jgi:glutaconate CoA-transferase subunit A